MNTSTIIPNPRALRQASPAARAKTKYLLGVTTITLAAMALALTYSKESKPEIAETFTNPPEISSANGVLTATLKAEKKTIAVGDQQISTRVYNGLYTPPLLRVRPGDVIKLKLINSIDMMTNLHYHGLNVSPLGNSDNVFIHVMPDEAFDYEVAIPKDHPPGLYWYHPHAHGMTEYQVFNGMSGGMIVEGLLDPLPKELRNIKDRVMLLKDIQVDADGDDVPKDIDSNQGTTRMINGQVNPTLKIKAGETQLWRIGNIGADIYYRLQLEGHVLYEIGRDGSRHNQVVPRQEIILPPSARVEVLVQGNRSGLYRFRTLAFNTGKAGDQYPEATLATLVSEGTGSDKPFPLPAALPAIEDLRQKPVANRRTFSFTETGGGDDEQFFINGKQFDINRIDTTVKLGALEEWTIQNNSDEMHVFHIHQLDFQVTEENGKAVPFVGYQDTVNLPVRGTVKVLIPFTDPVIVGKFVYHCHIMSHEDKGMMAVIQVVK